MAVDSQRAKSSGATVRLLATGPFVTRYSGALHGLGEGVLTAHRHRKGLGHLPLHELSTAVRIERELALLWQPALLGWWIAVGFSIGSSCFLAGGALSSFAAEWNPFDSVVIDAIFAIGAVFFTLAAYGQFLEALNAPPSRELYRERGTPGRWKWIGLRPRMIGWWASATQLVGTLAFNVMTLDSLLPRLGGVRGDILVWTPDMAGSICFLLASQLALIEVSHRFFSFRPHDLDWWIAALNMAGSVAFQISAFFAWFRPGSSHTVGPWWDNWFTFLGAACFLAGALLMLPELAERPRKPSR
jgi:hypothetical protein